MYSWLLYGSAAEEILPRTLLVKLVDPAALRSVLVVPA